MKRFIKNYTTGFNAAQGGQAIILVLLLLVVGSLVLVPALSLSYAALRSNRSYEAKTNELYTADSGIEDGIWRIKYEFFGPGYDEYDFDTIYSYDTDTINDLTAVITIQNVWIPAVSLAPGGLTPGGLDAADLRAIIEGERLIVSGTAGAIPGEPYSIKVDYDPVDPSENLTVTSIGVWLPQGFEYTAGSGTLENLTEGVDAAYAEPTVDPIPGGTSIVWSWSSPDEPLFSEFPDVNMMDSPISLDIQFDYSPPDDDPDAMPTAIAWITTVLEGGAPSDYPISWDVDTRIFKLTSTTGDVSIQAYSSKTELRQMGDAMNGEYIAIGNSLMLDNYSPYDRRDTLLTDSTTSISSVPADGDAVYAYLYWTGWLDNSNIITVLSDTCTSLDTNWNYASPTDWSASSGAFYARDGGGGAASHLLTLDPQDLSAYTPDSVVITWDQATPIVFSDTFSNLNNWTTSGAGTKWSISSGRARARYNTGGADSILTLTTGRDLTASGSGSVKVSWQMWASSTPGGSDGLDFALSSDNGSTWSSNIQAAFGTLTTSPQDYSYSVNSSYWTTGFKLRFQVIGFAGSTNLYVDNFAIEPVYGPADGLDFAVSDDNGATWSDNMEAFRDDIVSGTNDSFAYYLPGNYNNGQFVFRFETAGMEGPGQRIYLDNFKIRALPPDTQVTFKIDGEQVHYDGNGEPHAGSDPLEADSSAVLLAPESLGGYFYRCKTDVSRLVKTFPVNPGEENHTGNAAYTVGNVDGDTGNYLSHAGWSMILIYASVDTAGHYLYIRDFFADNPGSTNLDFDKDGVAGGDITNFVIPEPIRNSQGDIIETNAARLAVFVGEGDVNYSGDMLQITGQQSGSSAYLSNSASPWNNTWNGAGPDMSYPGVDVDTFDVTWASGILTPGDTTLHLDMPSGTDAWTFIYLIMSVRSETLTSGTTHYSINRN